MNYIEVMMLVFMTGTFCIISFLLGLGANNSKTKIKLNPVEAIKEHKETKKIEAENNLKQRQEIIMMENINNYPYKQQEIPKE